MSSTCLTPNCADNQSVGREDRAMLRSNPSARADARAWAAMLVSLLILYIHAWALKAINLLEPYIRTPPTQETPWLPLGKIFGAPPALGDEWDRAWQVRPAFRAQRSEGVRPSAPHPS